MKSRVYCILQNKLMQFGHRVAFLKTLELLEEIRIVAGIIELSLMKTILSSTTSQFVPRVDISSTWWGSISISSFWLLPNCKGGASSAHAMREGGLGRVKSINDRIARMHRSKRSLIILGFLLGKPCFTQNLSYGWTSIGFHVSIHHFKYATIEIWLQMGLYWVSG
jgi:hypothetical protein